MTEKEKKLRGEELAAKINEYSCAYVNGHYGLDENGQMKRDAYLDQLWADVFEDDDGVHAFVRDQGMSERVEPMTEAEAEAYVENWHDSLWAQMDD